MQPSTDDRLSTLRSLGIPRSSPGTPGPTGRCGEASRVRPLLCGTLILSVGVWVGMGIERWRLPGTAQQAELKTSNPGEQAPATMGPPPATGWQVAGYLVARRQAIVGSEVTAKVAQVLVGEGEHVARGQVMARLINATARQDLTIARSRAEAATANVQVIAAQLGEARRNRERARQLAPVQAISLTALENAEARYQQLAAQMAEARALETTARLGTERAELILEQHVVKAPFSGVVASCMAQPGEMISPISTLGAPSRIGICTLVDLDSLEIEIDVAESYISRLAPGMPAKAVVDALPDRFFSARVSAILPSANRERSTIRVRLTLAPPSRHLRPEMAVKVTFTMPDTPSYSSTIDPE
ncbi:efflux RND transporter periplasmic adaptor subunit [Pseudomonas piscis]